MRCILKVDFGRTLIAAAALLVPLPALADRIDGDWCYATQSLTINGPSIRTPGGNQIQGEYSRHGFVYMVPASETEAGVQIDMRLLGEEVMILARKNASKAEETWRRCKPTS
jgi:hypothetical protein